MPAPWHQDFVQCDQSAKHAAVNRQTMLYARDLQDGVPILGAYGFSSDMLIELEVCLYHLSDATLDVFWDSRP